MLGCGGRWARQIAIARTRLVSACSRSRWPAAGARAQRPARRVRRGLAVVAAENFWGSIAAQLAGDRAERDEHHRQPRHRPAQLRTDRAGRAHAGRRADGDRQRHRLRQLGAASCCRPARRAGASCWTSARVLGLREGDNPHQWYSPRSVRRVIGAIVAALRPAGPARRRVLRPAQAATVERRGLARYDALRRADPRALRRRAGRLQREHLPAARRRPRPAAADAVQLRQGDRRGHRRDRAPTSRRSTLRRAGGRSRCGCSTART